jgi:hypothetical protein
MRCFLGFNVYQFRLLICMQCLFGHVLKSINYLRFLSSVMSPSSRSDLHALFRRDPSDMAYVYVIYLDPLRRVVRGGVSNW